MQQTKLTTQEQIDEMRKEILREKQKMSGIRMPEAIGSEKLRKKKTVVRIAGRVVYLSVILMLIAALVLINMAKNRGEIPSLPGGFQLFTVESGSMEPTLNVGSVILCRKPQNAESLKENNIVTFRTLSGFIVTHRIVNVITDQDGNIAFRTKGDNPNNSTDQEVLTPDRVIAVFIARIPLT
jgi:signal peptidase I